ncbi:MAG: fimbrial major subunit CsuA/B family protein [Desulfobulbaceae bacterium]|nr:fimbrial major subunit CsuA/B family protein [Desulfobulbaceae bacterium]
MNPIVAWAGAITDASPTGDLAQVQCSLESASLNFGRLNLQQQLRVVGEGEAVLVCLNPSTGVHHVELTLAFPTMGLQTASLQANQDTLAVAFYHDAQFAERWGDDRNGAPALRVMLNLGSGERRRLRLPVYALLQNRHDAGAGVYNANIPITLTTQSHP